MARPPPHKQHIDRMNAFEMADRNTPRNALGSATIMMGAADMPRTPAQQASVKKAATKSAAARAARAAAKDTLPEAKPAFGKAIKKGLLGL